MEKAGDESVRHYNNFAKIYDKVMSDVPYKLWFEYINTIWNYHSFMPESVLDLACGTGNFSVLLAKAGYKVTGLDNSPEMLEIAKDKAIDQGLDIKWICDDMRQFKLNEKVDGAVSVFDSMNYLLEPEDIQNTFACVRDTLYPGGLFVFDMNSVNRLSSIATETTTYQGSNYCITWMDTWDEEKKWWQVQLTGFIMENGRCINVNEIHRERAYAFKNIRAWLGGAGFSVLGVYGPSGLLPATQSTSRAYFVSKRL